MAVRQAASGAGGDLLACFEEILAAAPPELAGHVTAVSFDADSGRPRPRRPGLRHQGALVDTEPSSAAALLPTDAPVNTAESASAGYQRTLTAYQDARPEHPIDPAVHAATERQIRARLREPEKDFSDGQHAQEEMRERAAHHRDTRSVEASRAAALRRLATEKAGQAAPRAHRGRTA